MDVGTSQGSKRGGDRRSRRVVRGESMRSEEFESSRARGEVIQDRKRSSSDGIVELDVRNAAKGVEGIESKGLMVVVGDDANEGSI